MVIMIRVEKKFLGNEGVFAVADIQKQSLLFSEKPLVWIALGHNKSLFCTCCGKPIGRISDHYQHVSTSEGLEYDSTMHDCAYTIYRL